MAWRGNAFWWGGLASPLDDEGECKHLLSSLHGTPENALLNTQGAVRSRIMGEVRRAEAILFVFALAMLSESISDFITGGTPVTPIGLLLFFAIPVQPVFAGLGVLMVREVAIRWKKGWVSTLLLGGALGIVWEGLFTKVIFGPASFAVVGYFGTYGHWLGVNWILAAIAFLFHGALTVAIPIFLADRLFPRIGSTGLLPGSRLWAGLGFFTVVVALVYVFIPLVGPPANLSPGAFVSSPPLVDVLLVMASVGVVAFVAWWVPVDALSPVAERPSVGLGAMGALGLAFSGGILLFGGPVEYLVPWPVVAILGMVGLALGTLFLARRWFGRTANVRHLSALVVGALAPYCIIASFLELGGDLGALPVAIALIALTVYVARKG
jgi:hypothetical protein